MNNLGDLIGKEIKEAAVAGFCHQAVDSLAEPGLQISGLLRPSNRAVR